MTLRAHLLTGRPTSELWFLSAVSTLLCVLITADCGNRKQTHLNGLTDHAPEPCWEECSKVT